MKVWKTTVPVALYRLTHGRVFGRIGGQPVLLLETTGRRSGRPRTTPIQYLRDGSAFVVVAANGGAARPPRWLLNLRAHPHARVQIGSQARDVIAHEATEEEYAALWSRLTAANRALENVAQRAGRRLPILVLGPDRSLPRTSGAVTTIAIVPPGPGGPGGRKQYAFCVRAARRG